MAHHDSGDVFRVISIQVELEGHHLVVVRLQLTLDHAVHFIRELQRRTGSKATSGVCLPSEVKHRRNNVVLSRSKHALVQTRA